MSKLQIRCINKADCGMPHERIRAISGFYANGSAWQFSQEEAIQKIEEGSCRFFVSIDARFLNVFKPRSRLAAMRAQNAAIWYNIAFAVH